MKISCAVEGLGDVTPFLQVLPIPLIDREEHYEQVILVKKCYI